MHIPYTWKYMHAFTSYMCIIICRIVLTLKVDCKFVPYLIFQGFFTNKYGIKHSKDKAIDSVNYSKPKRLATIFYFIFFSFELWYKLDHTFPTYMSHYSDVIMSAMASQITDVSIVYSTVCSGADKRKHQSSAALAFVTGIHRWPVNSPHKGQVTRKMLDDVIMRMILFKLQLGLIAVQPIMAYWIECDNCNDNTAHYRCEKANPPITTNNTETNRLLTPRLMMTSSNGNIFHVTGPLCGEFTGPGEFPARRPVTRSFGVFFDLRPNKRLINNREAGDLRRYRGHYVVIVMDTQTSLEQYFF